MLSFTLLMLVAPFLLAEVSGGESQITLECHFELRTHHNYDQGNSYQIEVDFTKSVVTDTRTKASVSAKITDEEIIFVTFDDAAGEKLTNKISRLDGLHRVYDQNNNELALDSRCRKLQKWF